MFNFKPIKMKKLILASAILIALASCASNQNMKSQKKFNQKKKGVTYVKKCNGQKGIMTAMGGAL